ncbi:SDR family oxidoreductase [Kushneria phosphatilytica]|uniref:sulfoacetaldehyde reductase (NADPH) n=1 Tax=Kushneria phosphatilytica TaxID=657387 RepID=A0A5C0ZZ27_9GAMM|nr:SDR family oxidoreductase [Kushneria phosphatilytica]QEL10643.1 SDR family oxidoreductase [Kushneria phosphatilytica]
MTQDIQGKVIVITGASSGLGEATARHLASHGAIVVLGARRMDRLQKIVDEIQAAGGKALALQTDVTRQADVQALVDKAVSSYGKIDVMLNNAGLMQQSPLEKLKIDEWDNMIDINLKGTLYGIAAVLPQMKSQQFGHVINVSSVAGHKVTPAGTVYCATKHAVRAISEGFRQEVKDYNLRSTIISPGAIDTELPSHITDSESSEAIGGFYASAAIPADSFARIVYFAITQPEDVDINEVLYRPTSQPL